MALIGTAEAARRLGITVERVNRLIRAGRLPALKPARDYLIEEADLELVKDRKPGRPKKHHPTPQPEPKAA